MKILITGVCGFVGSVLARALKEHIEDLTVCGIDSLTRPGSEINRARLKELGVELVHDQQSKTKAPGLRDRVVNLAFERGLLILGAGDNTLRLCPPLIISRDQCDFALDTLEDCFTLAMRGD